MTVKRKKSHKIDTVRQHIKTNKKKSLHNTINPTFLGALICLVAASFYLYEFFLRVSPSVMTYHLLRDLNISAIGFSTMAAFYFYGYAPMQVPAGLLIDRFGPRKLLTSMILICLLGTVIFGYASNVYMASLGRFLIGFGSAFAFIGALVLMTRWFPPYYFAFLAGLTQFMGAVGAIAGQAPLSYSVKHFGWRETSFLSAFIGLILLVLMWLLIRDHPSGYKKAKLFTGGIQDEFKRLHLVLIKQQNWAVAIYAFCIWAPISIFATTWGVAYLIASYRISNQYASILSATIWAGIAIGSPLAGLWSDKIKKRVFPLAVCAFIGTVSTSVLLLVPGLPKPLLFFVLFCFGLASSGQSLSFAVVKENNRPSIAGTAIGFNNMSVIAGGAILLPVVGFLLSLHWNKLYVSGAPYYLAKDYRFALLIIPISYLIAFLISIKMIRETGCKAQYHRYQHLHPLEAAQVKESV